MSKLKPATSTAIILHPTHSTLSDSNSLVKSLPKERHIILDFLPGGARTITLEQGSNHINVGVLLWRSGIAMGKFLSREVQTHRISFTNKRVIELGCGCFQLASIVAAEFGADVICTDGDHEVLKLARSNIKRNSLPDTNTGVLIQVREFQWNNSVQIQRLRGSEDKAFDVICAADVIYYQQGHKDLANSLYLLSKEDTVIFLGYENRQHDFENVFFSSVLPSFGFVCEIVWCGVEGDAKKVQIYKVTRKPETKHDTYPVKT